MFLARGYDACVVGGEAERRDGPERPGVREGRLPLLTGPRIGESSSTGREMTRWHEPKTEN